MLGRLAKRLLTGGVGKAGTGDGHGAGSYLDRYDRQFAPLLAMRAPSFRLMFELLEQKSRALDRPLLIVETGSARVPGRWAGEGQSTVLWDDFSQYVEAEIHSVDIDPNAARVLREEFKVGESVRIHTRDSVSFLHEFATSEPVRQIDLLYLDSFDFDIANPFPSSFHHMKELTAVRPSLGPGTIIAVDDNVQVEGGDYVGKGMFVDEWFSQVGIPRIYTGYQFIWKM